YDLDDLREGVDDITRYGQPASAVIARIRGFFQKTPVEDTPVDVNDLVREVAALMRSEMARRGVAVKLELAQCLPPALGRRIQLQQVILNLIVNGADAMEGVARDLRELVICSLENAAGAIVLTVKDVGAGIDAGNFDHLFDAFFTTKPAGMGMGLAICKSIVEAHGGTIWATSKPGQEAQLQCSMPAIPPCLAEDG